MDSHREGVMRLVEQTGIAFATMDYAGHGQHTVPLEDSTRKQQHDEVVAVYDALAGLGYKKIIVIGGSFGGYMAALLVGKRPAHAAILRVPAIYDDAEFALPHSQTKRWQNIDSYQDKASASYIEDNEAVRGIAHFEGFTYVLEHELDQVVPKIMPQTYFSHAKHGNYLIVPKTSHSPKQMSDPQKHYAYIEHLLASLVQAIVMQDDL